MPTPTTPPASFAPTRRSTRGAGTLQVSIAAVASLVAAAVCAFTFVNFAGADTITATTRALVAVAFGLCFLSAVAVNHVLEARAAAKTFVR